MLGRDVHRPPAEFVETASVSFDILCSFLQNEFKIAQSALADVLAANLGDLIRVGGRVILPASETGFPVFSGRKMPIKLYHTMPTKATATPRIFFLVKSSLNRSAPPARTMMVLEWPMMLYVSGLVLPITRKEDRMTMRAHDALKQMAMRI